MSTISSLISSGGGGSEVNDIKFSNSTANLITTESDEVWLKGGVTETDITTYPDATSAFAYSGTSFVITAQENEPRDITWDGTYFWVLGGDGRDVGKYNASGTYQNVAFSVISQDNAPTGLEWDGTHFWVVGQVTNKVYKYTSAGVYTNTSYALSQGSNPRGIAWGRYIFLGSY